MFKGEAHKIKIEVLTIHFARSEILSIAEN
jgi:hypothetical protein